MKKLFAIFMVAMMTGRALAIVVSDYTTAESPPTGQWDVDWNYVYNYKNASSVGVGEYWILTAGHVADDGPSGNLTINGTTYFQQEIIFHQGSDDPENASNADLALVRYDKPLPGFYELYTGGFSTSFDMVMVGFGYTGKVVNLFLQQDYYTDSGTGRGTRRWGTQAYDRSQTVSYTIPPLSTTNAGFWMDFDVGNTPYEAGVGVFDSGGGTFYKQGGTWKLAGINTLRNGANGQFTSTFALSIPKYDSWINQTIDSVTGDSDSDGLPNWWEEQFSTNVLSASDQDGDGMTGEEEFVADTDPTNENSFFRFDETITASSQTFTFDGSTARQYQLLTTTNDLTDPSLIWVTNGVPIWGEGAGTQISTTNIQDTVFYRLRVTLP